MNQIPQWHPKLNVYRHEGHGLLLLSEMSSLWLSDEHFAGMEHIDGLLDETQIIQKLTGKGPQQGAMFLYQLNQLRRGDLIVDLPNDELTQYCCNKVESAVTLVKANSRSIVSLSAADVGLLDFWCSLIESIDLVDKPVTLLLVDDFLDPRIADIDADTHND
ncbi:MAG: hypothetical protein MJK04_33685, partial [Psychrosphaera sp.]|nr:hypothetical protein [Psychrosphaera sp.]